MNGRTCLLCGKPLSRLWVGAGEDFCSREHRNQYRLRRGMDRLLEANKVANLMRRRENPKPISRARLMSESSIQRRGFLEPRWAPPGAATLAAAPSRWRLKPCLDAAFERSFATLPARLAEDARLVQRAADRVPMAPRASALSMPVSRTQQPVGLARAAVAPSFGAAQAGDPRQRPTRIAAGATLRLHLDPSHHLPPPPAEPFQNSCGSRPLDLSGTRGYAMRVSAGVGFRIPDPRRRGLRTEAFQPRLADAVRQPSLSRRSRLGQPISRLAGAPALPPGTPSFPTRPGEMPAVHMAWPGVIMPAAAGPHEGTELLVRSHGEIWTQWSETTLQPIPHGGKDAARPRHRVLRPAGRPAMPRATAVPIGGAADGVDTRPAAPPENRTLEERFDAGWQNWMGGFANWTVDAAGARTGSLALYRPSLEWRDYELEFFTRIENHSVNWVFRASNLNDYYMATLTALPGKGYAFTHRQVIRGKAGVASTEPVSILPNPKSAYLIRMKVAADRFSVAVDGQWIATWSDHRLSTGGIGFLGAPDDRARIYWVRVCPRPDKESTRT